MVKTIRYKTDLLKVNEDGMVLLDRVCRALVLKDESVKLKYKKYSKLDLSNVREIVATGINLLEVPLWIKECKRLTKLNLNNNQIGRVRGADLPVSL